MTTEILRSVLYVSLHQGRYTVYSYTVWLYGPLQEIHVHVHCPYRILVRDLSGNDVCVVLVWLFLYKEAGVVVCEYSSCTFSAIGPCFMVALILFVT